MNKYYYFPVLKTRSSEIRAYDLLSDEIKDIVLPIIELTGALGYTYPSNHKNENLRKFRRKGDINKKINKILEFVGTRKFILDITDDKTLMYDGLSSNGGLLDPENGYSNWLTFLLKDESFKKLVIPTIQLDTNFRDDVESQIQSLAGEFSIISIKLPTLIGLENIESLVSWILRFIDPGRLILILDFGYIKALAPFEELIKTDYVNPKSLSKIKGIISVSSSFPRFVNEVSKPIKIEEYNIFNLLKSSLRLSNIYMGDYASLHPQKYEMGGGGWIPRIDYIVRDPQTGFPLYYDYVRGKSRNTSSEYIELAKAVKSEHNYREIPGVVGDDAILQKANGMSEGKSPSFWISMRSNAYMTSQALYLKNHAAALCL